MSEWGSAAPAEHISFRRGSLPYCAAIFLVALFAASAIQRIWVHPSGPHTFRQADTLGFCLAASEEIKTRGWAGFDYFAYPRLLEKGLLDGINAKEFPLLDVMGALFFLPTPYPWIGVFGVSIFILALNLLTAYFYLPRFLRFWGIKADGLVCLVLWLCVEQVALQASCVMPEGLAFPLVIIGMVKVMESRGRYLRLALGAAICAIAVAVKPTMAIAYAGLAPVRSKRAYLFLALGLIFPAWWYTAHARAILSFAQGPQWVPLAVFSPLEKLKDLGLIGVLKLAARESMRGQFPIYLGWVFVVGGAIIGAWGLLLLYAAALLGTMALDGSHLFIHGYYFLGATAVTFPLIAKVIGAARGHRILRGLLVVSLLWGVLYGVRDNVWTWARDSHFWQWDPWAMGTRAREIIPDSYHLVTDDGPYPQRLLYIGRSGTLPKDANPFSVCDKPGYQNLKLALVSTHLPTAMAAAMTAEGPDSRSPACPKHKTRLTILEGPLDRWYITLADPVEN